MPALLLPRRPTGPAVAPPLQPSSPAWAGSLSPYESLTTLLPLTRAPPSPKVNWNPPAHHENPPLKWGPLWDGGHSQWPQPTALSRGSQAILTARMLISKAFVWEQSFIPFRTGKGSHSCKWEWAHEPPWDSRERDTALSRNNYTLDSASTTLHNSESTQESPLAHPGCNYG